MLQVSSLRQHQVDAVYPLMHSALHGLTLEAWRAYVAGLDVASAGAPPDRGIIVASSPDGVLRGAFAFAIETHADVGPTLIVHHLVIRHLALPLLGQGLAARALGDAIEQIARERDCRAVTIELPPDAEWEIRYFTERGFRIGVGPSQYFDTSPPER